MAGPTPKPATCEPRVGPRRTPGGGRLPPTRSSGRSVGRPRPPRRRPPIISRGFAGGWPGSARRRCRSRGDAGRAAPGTGGVRAPGRPASRSRGRPSPADSLFRALRRPTPATRPYSAGHPATRPRGTPTRTRPHPPGVRTPAGCGRFNPSGRAAPERRAGRPSAVHRPGVGEALGLLAEDLHLLPVLLVDVEDLVLGPALAPGRDDRQQGGGEQERGGRRACARNGRRCGAWGRSRRRKKTGGRQCGAETPARPGGIRRPVYRDSRGTAGRRGNRPGESFTRPGCLASARPGG